MIIEGEGFIPEPGDVYEYTCGNDQGYGYMVPVKTSKGWDFIDTYHLGTPLFKSCMKSYDEASVAQVMELALEEHDIFVRRRVFDFYHRNAFLGRETVPDELSFLFSLNDYRIASRRECRDYEPEDTILNVPLYREQRFDWDSGRALGLCFVRCDADKSLRREFGSLLEEAEASLPFVSALLAAEPLEKAAKKLDEMRAGGLATGKDEEKLARIKEKTDIISRCAEELRAVDAKHCGKEVVS